MNNIYINVKYPLTKIQLSKIEKVWIFIKDFYEIETDNNTYYIKNKKLFGPYEYRRLIIDKISKKYTVNEFYDYEKIINKLYWNLHYRLNITSNNCNIVKKNKLEKIIKRSFINKSINYNQKNSKYYIISDYIRNITEKESNLLYSLLNERLYKKIMNNPLTKMKIDFSLYYPNDYPFPNANRCFYNKNKKDYWKKKIFLMYYSNNDKYWYNLIYP